MPKFRHIAIVCDDPAKLGEWYQKAFDLQLIHRSEKNGVTVLSDGEFNLTLLHSAWVDQNTPHKWHFGLEMTMEEIEARRAHLEEMGASYSDGVRDGRSVEVYTRDPEGHRIDLAPYWPVEPGADHRKDEYREWEAQPETAREVEAAPASRA
jgi:catechol 2,3-dioxygenase-like lactoylglutathione lyase family enzyme